jgi:hypothetical protein
MSHAIINMSEPTVCQDLVIPSINIQCPSALNQHVLDRGMPIITFVYPVKWFFSVFLSLPQWHIKFPWTFKFVTAAFNFIIFAPFLKCNVSIMYNYKSIGQKASERPIIRLHVPVFLFL